ncbi:MAG TPA: type II CAAX endopeptidase family protein [Terriglobales bacterium]|jgi:hypothetical protein|nr:type II CAAX endopeptidase family protein [Terriglobales bacterium]
MQEADSPSLLPDQQPVEIPAPPPRPFIVSVFLGPDGLRAGWRFALYLGMFLLLSAVLGALAKVAHPKTFPLMWRLLIGECVALTSALIPAVVMGKIEGRRFFEYGLPLQSAFGRLFWAGAAWGLAGLTLLLGIMRGAGVFYFGHVVLHGPRVIKFAVFYVVLFLIVAFFEEFWVRGYSLFTLTKGMGFWPAAVLLSLAFGAIHLGNKNEAITGAAAAAAIGFFLCLTLRRTGTLWFAVGFHAAWDWGETYLYSVPDSGLSMPGQLTQPSFQGKDWLTGGSVGPEGSVFVFVVVAILALIFHRLYREAKYLV